MKKLTKKPLHLATETVRTLDLDRMTAIVGGASADPDLCGRKAGATPTCWIV